MKISKLVSAGSLALALAGVASASQSSPAVLINIVGSTAFRNAVTAAEVATLSNVGTNLAGGHALASYTGSTAFNGSNQSGASQSNVYGYLSDGTTEVMYRNDWTGSAAGLIDLTQGNSTLTFIPTSATMSAVNGGGGTAYSSTLVTATPSVTLCDVDDTDIAESIKTQGTVGKSYSKTILSAALQDGGQTAGPNGCVAVITFEWVTGAVASGQSIPTNLTNMTTDNASALISGGNIPLSQFTGNTSDENNFVLLVGRSEDSGSRVTAFGEAQSGGIAATEGYGQSCQQYMLQQTGVAYPTSAQPAGYPSISTGTGLTSFKLWPTNWGIGGESSLAWASTGHSGYNGGGDVAAILNTPNPVVYSSFSSVPGSAQPSGVNSSSQLYFVGYLGVTDAAKVTNGRALTYNGVAYSTAAVIDGQYGFWGYEHLYYLTSATGSQVAIGSNQTAADALADTIFGLTSSQLSAGVNFSSMFASKGFAAGSAAN
jgi:hypothetical protein